LAAETVVITGAAGGIGEALALRFAAAGRRVAVLDVDETGAQRVAAELEAQGTPALGLGCDVTVADDCRAAIAAVTRAWGGVDLLVNNAGITHLGRFRDTAPDVIRRVMEVNFFGAVEMTRAALPSLLQRRGAVVVLSSVAGFAPLATRTGYAASKHALQGFFDSLREEHRPRASATTPSAPTVGRPLRARAPACSAPFRRSAWRRPSSAPWSAAGICCSCPTRRGSPGGCRGWRRASTPG
jgi:NAD(P)-dependent dehydrogenase (short-subunit alcohol dehydrogenase family)